MTTFQFFKVTVKHDNGRSSLVVSAQDADKASLLVQVCECCPKSAIQKVQPLTDKQAKRLRGW